MSGRKRGLLGRRVGRSWLAVGLVALAAVGAASGAIAGDRTNVPLKNWGGFSEFYDATYDDLERLVTAGLADRVLLNTRPLSRLEAAKIVARAIEKIRGDEMGGLNARRDLEPVLDRLMEEFKVELASLGVRTSVSAAAPGFVSFTPVDRAQVFGGYASRQYLLVNDQGRPELLENADYGAARLATGYAKLTLYNVELLVGRDSLAWGPGYHNALMLSKSESGSQWRTR